MPGGLEGVLPRCLRNQTRKVRRTSQGEHVAEAGLAAMSSSHHQQQVRQLASGTARFLPSAHHQKHRRNVCGHQHDPAPQARQGAYQFRIDVRFRKRSPACSSVFRPSAWQQALRSTRNQRLSNPLPSNSRRSQPHCCNALLGDRSKYGSRTLVADVLFSETRSSKWGGGGYLAESCGLIRKTGST